YHIDLQHNTVVESGIDAVSIVESTRNVTLENNIFVTDGAGSAALRVAPTAQRGFSADWNVYHATGGADHIHWQTAFNDRALWWLETGFDAHSQFVNPQFADALNDNYTLLVASPSRGMADPDSSRVNIGAFDDALPLDTYRIVGPFTGQKFLERDTVELTWQTRGATSGTVTIEYSVDGGSNWTMISAGTDDDSLFEFNLPSTLSPILDARVRITDSVNPLLTGEAQFTVGRDSSVFYASTSGSVGNTGTTAADPLPSLAAVLHSYELENNRNVELDAGIYETFVPLTLPSGLKVYGDAVLDRNNTNPGGALLIAERNITLIDLELINAFVALDLSLSTSSFSVLTDVTIRDNILGIYIEGSGPDETGNSLVVNGGSLGNNTTAIENSGIIHLSQVLLNGNTLGIDNTGNARLNDSQILGGDTGIRIEGGWLNGGIFNGQAIRSILVEGTADTWLRGFEVKNGPVGLEFLATGGTHRIFNGVFSGNVVGVQATDALGDGGALLLLNHTFHGSGVTHVELVNSINTRLRDIIFSGAGSTAIEADTASSVGFTSDYTLFDPGLNRVASWQGVEFLDLTAWQVGTGFDPNSISADPLFVDANNGDFHLTALSPGIDAGDPFLQTDEEPSPNGGRANLGAYGLTAEAATSPAASLTVTSPSGGERLEQGTTAEIRWTSDGLGAVSAVESYRNAVLDLAPRAYLSFDSALNGLVPDYSVFPPGASVFDHSGTLLNGTQLGGPGAFAGSGAAVFDGIDDVITLPGDPLMVEHYFTVSAWVYGLPGLQDDATIVHYHNSNGLNSGFALRHVGGEIVFSVQPEVGGDVSVSGAFSFETWTHVVAVYGAPHFGSSDLTMDLYLNGTLVDSRVVTDGPALPPDQAVIEIGGNSEPGFFTGFGSPWKGSIDEVAIFHQPLVPGSFINPIADLYQSATGTPGSEEVSIRINGQLIAAAQQDDGSYAWNIPSNFPVGQATVTLETGSLTATSNLFYIVPPGHHYYINDDAVNPGDLTTVIGNDL
ncbi:MAG: hypothetical protein KDL87_08060, partial [Verrucomicrobiae bacterium]|nr:hypothetical protein [Verrucomicrobiae bacterium]